MHTHALAKALSSLSLMHTHAHSLFSPVQEELVFHLPAGLIVTVRNRGGGGLRGGTWREEQEPKLLAMVWLGKKK